VDAFGGVLAVQVARDVVQLGQTAALGVGQQQLDGLQRAGERLLDGDVEVVDAVAGERADLDPVGMTVALSSVSFEGFPPGRVVMMSDFSNNCCMCPN